MDENVVFNPTKQETTSQQTPQSGEGGGEAIPPEGGDDVELAEAQEPPPPSGPLAFFKAHWLKLLLGILLLLIILFLVNLFSPKKQVDQHVKLVWWGLWEDSPSMQVLIDDFKKEHPNIDIEYSKRSPNDYYAKLLSRIDSGTGPDIYTYHNSWVSVLADKLAPLSVDVIDPKAFKEAYYTVVQKDLMKNNAILGIPMGIDSLAMYTNAELFSNGGVQVPNDWDEFRKVSKQLTVKDPANGKIKQAGAALGTFSNVRHASDIVSLLYMQQGVDLATFKGSTQSKEDALKFYISFAKGEDNVWDETLDNSLLAFSKGNVAIYFGYSWDMFAIQKLNKDLKFKISTVPSLSKTSTIASYWVEGVSAKSKQQREALLFMQYLAKKETAQKYYTQTAKTRAFGALYARKDLRETLREEPLVYPFLSQLDDASSTLFSSDTRDGDTGINTILNKYLENAVSSVISDGDSVQSANETLEAGVAQVLQQNGIAQQ